MLAWLVLKLRPPGSALPPVWPASGAALAWALGPGRRHPWVAVLAYPIVLFALEGWSGDLSALDAAVVGANAVELGIGLWLIPLWMGARTIASHPRDALWRLIGGAVAASGTGALVAAGAIAALAPNSGRAVGADVGLWWVSHGTNTVLAAPALFSWIVLRAPRDSWPPKRIAEAVALAVSTWALTALIFSELRASGIFVPHPFGILPLLLWAAVRFGLRGAGAASVLVMAVASTRSALGEGPFARGGEAEWAVLQAQLFAAVLGVSAYLVAGILEERRRDLRSLADREEVFRRAEAAAHVGSWRWDLPEGTVEWSDELYRIFGVRRGEFDSRVDTILDRLVHPDDRERVRDATSRAAAEGRPVTVEYRIVRADGTIRVVRGEGGDVLCDSRGRPAKMFGTIQDVTGLRAAEREALQAQKVEALGAMAGGIAHDLNNTLTVILGHVSAAIERLPTGNLASPHLGHALRGIRRASTLAASLLAYSGRGQVELRRLDPAAFVAAERPSLENTLPPGVRLAGVDEPGAEVEADPEQLRRLLRLLLENAAEALAGREGVIELSVRPVLVGDDAAEFGRLLGEPLPPGRYALVEMRDDGPGMSAEVARRAFDPFFTTKTAGRGLGLPAVLGIVRGHRGGLRLTTASPGGTRVEVLLPAAEYQREASREAE